MPDCAREHTQMTWTRFMETIMIKRELPALILTIIALSFLFYLVIR